MTGTDLLTRALELAMSSAQASRLWFEQRASGNRRQQGGSARESALAMTRGDLLAVTGSAFYSLSPAECSLWSNLDRHRWHGPGSGSAASRGPAAELGLSE